MALCRPYPRLQHSAAGIRAIWVAPPAPQTLQPKALRSSSPPPPMIFGARTTRGSSCTVFERTFKDFDLPRVIRTDNGIPFASRSAFFGLSKLSVWWLRLGIRIERIKPGKPQQNGRHERMHPTLKKEATRPAGRNFLQQQAKFDRFMQCYNFERPHQAIGMKCPAEIYSPSQRPYQGLGELEYPFHDRTITVSSCGRICIGRRKINLSQVFAGQKVGIEDAQREDLARDLHAIRPGLLRPGARAGGMRRKSLRR